MLAVAEIDYIRHEVNQKGQSYASVAKRMNHDARTIKKYADLEEFPAPKKAKRKARVLDPIKPILDAWIKEDLKLKKKFQRTAKRMYDLLVEKHGFEGSDRTVRRYVKEKKEQLYHEASNASLPLETIEGTAQVDFGKAPFKYQGKHIELPFLVMSFPSANTFYFQVFPSENTECLLEGLQRIFQRMKSVPKTIRFDNLSPAVKKIHAKGKRDLTDMFERFVHQYGFSYEFCNPGKGNEKGHVEAMVKYIRNNFLLPAMTIIDLEDFNQSLWEKAEADRNRKHYKRNEELSVLHEKTVEQHLVLPEKPFNCARQLIARADKSGMIKISNKWYSTSPRFAKQKVLVEITYNEIRVLNEKYEAIAIHPRLYGTETTSIEWQPYLNLLAKRPRAIKYSSVYDYFPLIWRTYLKECTEDEQKSAFILLAEIMKKSSLEQATEALKIAMQNTDHPTVEEIKQIHHTLHYDSTPYRTIELKSVIPVMPDITRNTDRYDILLRMEDQS